MRTDTSGVHGVLRTVSRGLLLALLLAGFSALVPSLAGAAIAHNVVSSFDGSDVPGGPFGLPGADAADQASGDVYVVDWVHGVVDKFDSSGAYPAGGVQLTGTPAGSFSLSFASGVAVDNSGQATDPSNGDVYVANTNDGGVDKFTAAGGFVCQITGEGSASSDPAHECSTSLSGVGSITPTGLAVDADGNLFVADTAHDVVDEFDSHGNYTGHQISDPNITSPGPIAVDPSGNVYITNQFSNVVKYSPSGSSFAFDKVLDASQSTAVGVDPATGNVYVADNAPSARVVEYDSSGNTVDTFGPPNVGLDVLGVGIGAVGQVYTSDLQNDRVEIFAGDHVSTGPASDVTTTSATLSGTVDPYGATLTSCEFEYVAFNNYNSSIADPYSPGKSVPCTPTPAGTKPVPVSANVTGLSPGTAYSFRLVAGNATGASEGADGTFATTPLGFGIKSFSSLFTNQDGSPDTQAGSHPWAQTTSFTLNSVQDTNGVINPVGQLRDSHVNLPAGFVGNPSATPQCTQQEFEAATANAANGCPPDTQVGTLTLTYNAFNGPRGVTAPTVGLYNLVPPAGEVARLGAVATLATIYIDVGIRTGSDYGVTAASTNISTLLPVLGVSVTLWGVPADPSHDDLRCENPTQATGLCATPASSGAPDTPFLTMPSACSGPLTATMTADSWENPGTTISASATTDDQSGHPVGINGCNQLDFSPTLSVQPDTSVADSPAGLDVDLHMPQDGLLSPTGLGEASLKNAVVTLPAGVSVNPAAADGLQGCTPAEIGIDNANPATCPNASALGSVEVDTPLLPDPLKGYVYQAQQTQNPFGSLLAIYVVAQGDGVLVKLAGNVHTDPVTGQVTTTFSNNPQLPFSDFKLDFYGGSRAALATPESCGTFTTTSDMTPWSSPSEPDASPGDSFPINSGCVSGFSPTLTAGTQSSQAGAYAPFVLSLARSDSDQNFQGLSVTLPPGMVAKLAGVQECSDQQVASISSAPGSGALELANPSCPAGSQVGTVQTGAGVGPDPYYIQGKAYLTGPYKGAPYGLAVVVPAVAGPLDLGTVVVRQALYVDPTTAQVTAVSDPLPTILDGIPLRIRRIDVDLSRHDFTVNPTSCDPMSIGAQVFSTGGLGVGASSRFQVGGCSGLGFAPRLKFALSGRGKTRSGDHPTLTATLTQGAGQANLRSARVALPLSLALDVNNSQHVCNYDTAQAVRGGAVGCPASTIVGRATAVTPLLSQPLSGSVYLVQGIRFGKNGQRIDTLPSLLIPLRGQISLDLRASSAVNGAQQLVTTFSTIPDAAVSKFTLQINGGPKGILVITGRGLNICAKQQIADASFGAQSGEPMSSAITMSKPCTVTRHTRRISKHKGGRK